MVMAVVEVRTVDDGDDLLPLRRAIPPFPWSELRYILMLGGEYSPNTAAKQIPMTRHRHYDGLRAEAMESMQQGKALVMTALARAFNENYRRHNLTPAHWKAFLACEVGLVHVSLGGTLRLGLYRPERPDAVLPYEQAPQYIDVRPDLAQRYHGEARRAITEEWNYLHSGWEK